MKTLTLIALLALLIPNAYAQTNPGTPSGPLPIKLISFIASTGQNQVTLSWSINAADPCGSFSAERSMDGQNFAAFADQQASPATSGIANYSLADRHPITGTNLYRIRITDRQGIVTYTPVLKVMMNGTANPIVVRQQPVLSTLYLDQIIDGSIRIMDISGRMVRNIQATSASSFDVSDLQSGQYVIQISTPTGSSAVRFMKQ